MFVVFGIKLDFNKKLIYGLQKIYGIGKHEATHICTQLNIPLNIKISQLTEKQKSDILNYIKDFYEVENVLRKKINFNIQRYVQNQSIRGFRHRHGLPVRGQRTHTNGRTKKKRKFKF
jgi:small subunit ribosomal protein S13